MIEKFKEAYLEILCEDLPDNVNENTLIKDMGIDSLDLTGIFWKMNLEIDKKDLSLNKDFIKISDLKKYEQV